MHYCKIYVAEIEIAVITKITKQKQTNNYHRRKTSEKLGIKERKRKGG
jgi:hypothetical protein